MECPWVAYESPAGRSWSTRGVYVRRSWGALGVSGSYGQTFKRGFVRPPRGVRGAFVVHHAQALGCSWDVHCASLGCVCGGRGVFIDHMRAACGESMGLPWGVREATVERISGVHGTPELVL